MKLIFGLGNPGRKYLKTRHNLGFLLLDKFARKYDFSFSTKLFKSIIAEGLIRFSSAETKTTLSLSVVLVKPQTYMNLSGEAVFSLFNWYKADLKDIIVICDDVSLPVGTLRFRAKGGSGGHNGLKSIINLLKSQDFPRLRIGIDTPPGESLEEYVLKKLSDEDMASFDTILNNGVEGLECLLSDGIEKAMNLYNKNFSP